MSTTGPESWHCIERGEGRPLILLHGIGMTHHIWLSLIDKLAAEGRRVVAFDLPGFGNTPALRQRIVSIEHLADDFMRELRQRGIAEPVDIVGSSLGGRIALEVARHGTARSIVAISPAGLWPGYKYPPIMLATLSLSRFGATLAPNLTRRVLRNDFLRNALLSVPLAAEGKKIPAEEAIEITERFANAPGFWPISMGFSSVRNTDGITARCTVVFGRQDRLLPEIARDRSLLPAHTEWIEPEGWGHVPIWDDPEGVVRLILEKTA